MAQLAVVWVYSPRCCIGRTQFYNADVPERARGWGHGRASHGASSISRFGYLNYPLYKALVHEPASSYYRFLAVYYFLKIHASLNTCYAVYILGIG